MAPEYPVADVRISMDNVGKYKEGSSRVGLLRRVAVAANGCANFLYRQGVGMLQMKYELSPRFYAAWNTVPPTALEVQQEVRGDEKVSEQQCIDAEVVAGIHEQLEHVLGQCTLQDDDRGLTRTLVSFSAQPFLLNVNLLSLKPLLRPPRCASH